MNLIFRSLANFPSYLAPAWQLVSPLARTCGFETAADGLRATSLLEPAPSSRREWSEVEDLDRLRAFNATIHYVLPKLLLVTTAFEMSAFKGPAQNGSPARGGGAGEIPLGVADGTTRAEMVGPDKAAGVVATLFARIKERHDHPLVSSYYRALGNWPDFLEAHGARWSHGSAPMRTSSGNAL